ncbi:MAG: aminopeptidase [Patescibacteria group bacterium]
MGTLQQGAYNAINISLKVQPQEKVVIIGERDNLETAQALEAEALKITDRVSLFIMEDFGRRPVAWPNSMEKEYVDTDVSIYVASGVGNEIVIFRTPMIRAIHANPNIRHAHLIGMNKEIMADGMCTDFKKVKAVGDWLYNKVKEAREITVTSPAGTNLVVEFTPSYDWVLSDGFINKGNSENLPPGEVFTTPINVNGRMVIDGCLGDRFSEEYGDLASSPISLRIKDSWVVPDSIDCQNLQLQQELIDYLFNQEENSSRVGEFAFGINTELKGFIGNLLQDEKFPGIHLGFGTTSPEQTKAEWTCATHLDGVMRYTNVVVDGEMVMKKGEYLK